MLKINWLKPVAGAAVLSSNRGFHAASVNMVRQKHLRRLNRLHKHWAKQMFAEETEWVDPVLGKPQTPFLLRVNALLNQPHNQVDSMVPEETAKLLYGASLAATSATPTSTDPMADTDPSDAKILSKQTGKLRENLEQHKRQALLRIISLQNSNRQQSQKQAVKLAVDEFQRFPGDTGSPEVQAAISTIRIQFVARHAKETKKDVQTKRRLEHMVQTRRNLLLYLKRTEPKRYIWAIEKLGLSDDTLSEEFHMSRQYLWRTQFYGDKTLPMKKTVKDTKKARDLATKRGKAERYLAQHDPDALMRVHA